MITYYQDGHVALYHGMAAEGLSGDQGGTGTGSLLTRCSQDVLGFVEAIA